MMGYAHDSLATLKFNVATQELCGGQTDEFSCIPWITMGLLILYRSIIVAPFILAMTYYLTDSVSTPVSGKRLYPSVIHEEVRV